MKKTPKNIDGAIFHLAYGINVFFHIYSLVFFWVEKNYQNSWRIRLSNGMQHKEEEKKKIGFIFVRLINSVKSAGDQ